jgi:hypothetical protein
MAAAPEPDHAAMGYAQGQAVGRVLASQLRQMASQADEARMATQQLMQGLKEAGIIDF